MLLHLWSEVEYKVIEIVSLIRLELLEFVDIKIIFLKLFSIWIHWLFGIAEDIFDFTALVFVNLTLNLLDFLKNYCSDGTTFQQQLRGKKKGMTSNFITFQSILNYERGENDDTSKNLYQTVFSNSYSCLQIKLA